MKRNMWLACTASPGQFSNELAVRGHDYEGMEFSLFTARQFVQCPQALTPDSEEVDAFVRIDVLQEREGLCLVQLPGQTFDNGSTITVRRDQLTENPSHQFA